MWRKVPCSGGRLHLAAARPGSAARMLATASPFQLLAGCGAEPRLPVVGHLYLHLVRYLWCLRRVCLRPLAGRKVNHLDRLVVGGVNMDGQGPPEPHSRHTTHSQSRARLDRRD